ncbi:MAG: hypothetical protein HYS27_11600 [Deltaproteobacteria bacterium]|nr:hypothetical protein [Deltaproteobacteria bacterium]
MSQPSHPDRDALLMKISAYLDGELSAEDERLVLDALSRDAELLSAFEAMSAARLPGATLGADDAETLTASVLAATGHAAPATAGGAAQLASLAMDDALDEAGMRRLELVLHERPALAGGVLGLLAAAEAVQVAGRAAAELPASAVALRERSQHVIDAVAADERLGTLVSGAFDGELTTTENTELTAGLARAADAVASLRAARFAGEALAAASHSAPFLVAASKAGEAALHVVAAEQARAAAGGPAALHETARPEARPGLLARLRHALGGLSAPLAFAATAATIFFVLREPGSASSDLAAREAAKKALFDALAPAVIADSLDLASAAGELPLLADNAADVEAIDATSTTMVFATEQSNITVIWVADLDDSQGT